MMKLYRYESFAPKMWVLTLFDKWCVGRIDAIFYLYSLKLSSYGYRDYEEEVNYCRRKLFKDSY